MKDLILNPQKIEAMVALKNQWQKLQGKIRRLKDTKLTVESTSVLRVEVYVPNAEERRLIYESVNIITPILDEINRELAEAENEQGAIRTKLEMMARKIRDEVEASAGG